LWVARRPDGRVIWPRRKASEAACRFGGGLVDILPALSSSFARIPGGGRNAPRRRGELAGDRKVLTGVGDRPGVDDA